MKTAVFMHGHARTWNYTKTNTIALMSQLYGEIDWFFGAPKTFTVSAESIRDDFAGQNLVCCVLMDEQTYPLPSDHDQLCTWRFYSPAYWKMAWTDYHLGIAKRRYEFTHGFKYDNVIFLRPDCWYLTPKNINTARYMLHPMSVSVTVPNSGGMHLDDWVCSDLAYRAGSAAADLISMRWHDPWYDVYDSQQLIHGNSHALLARYVSNNNIAHDHRAGFFSMLLVRPDWVDQLPWGPEKHDPNFNDNRTWHARSTADKIQWCQKLGIDPRDYQLVD